MSTVARAAFQIIPSEWYEGFPMVVVEAYACGTPVVASQIGSLDEIVVEGVTGVKFAPGNPHDLAAKVKALWNNEELRSKLRQNARTAFEKKYSEGTNFEALMAIYQAAIKDHAQTARR